MASVPRAYVDGFTRSLNALSADMRPRLADALGKVDFSAPVAEVREACIAAMELFCGPYTDMASELAAEFYDGLRELSAGGRLGALAESGRVPEATEAAVRAIMQDVVDGKPADVVAAKLLARADYEVKRSAGECVYRNGARDPLKVRYARVPSGGETCAFCIMLASRGFVYHSAETAGKGGHYHANCDCRIVPGFDGAKSSVEGYDPDALYRQWKGMEGFTIPEAKLTKYALNPEKDKDKATAFEKALGVRGGDAGWLMAKVYEAAGGQAPTFRNADEWGERYYHDLEITGLNGKKARVKVGWIKEPGAAKMRLTTIHVDE